MDKKFNPEKFEKLNNPERLIRIPPEYIWEKLDIPNCSVIIDIGAGTGLFSRAFSKLMTVGKVYSTDISPIMINWMNENIIEEYNNIIPLLTEESRIPLDDGIGDLVLMITIQHELDDPDKLLSEVRRVLKKGGKICIIDWKKKPMSSGPPFEIRLTSDQIINQLKSAGFTSVQNDETLDMFTFLQAVN